MHLLEIAYQPPLNPEEEEGSLTQLILHGVVLKMYVWNVVLKFKK